MILSLTQAQWIGAALLAAGIVWLVAPAIVSKLRSWAPVTPPVAFNDAEALSDRMSRLAQLQSDLEQRGHKVEADLAGGWYALLRDPIQQQEAAP